MSNFIERRNCPVCGSSQFIEIYFCSYSEYPIKDYLDWFYMSQGCAEHDLLEGGWYALEECGKCSLIFQRFVPNNLLLYRLYEVWIDPEIEQQNNLEKTRLNRIRYVKEIKLIERLLKKPLKDSKFLDFGMGWSGWLNVAKELGVDCYGCELSKKKIKFAKSLGINTIGFDDVTEYKFDYIHTEQVFEHLVQPYLILEKLTNSIKKGGCIKISVPDGKGIKKKLRKDNWFLPKNNRNSLNPVAPLEHLNCFIPQVVKYMCNSVGLEIVKPSFYLQWRYSSDWDNAKDLIKNIIKPIYEKLGFSTSLYFRKI